MKFTAHLDTLLPGLPVPERIKTFKESGFNAFEFWCHWQYDLKELAREAEKNAMEIAAFATEFISLADSSCREEYLAGFSRSLSAGQTVGCRRIITQVGNELPGVAAAVQTQSIIDGLCAAGELAAKDGFTILVEPLNVLVDHAGYFLSRSDAAAEIIEKVDMPHVKMLFDIYHQQITEGNLIANIGKYLPLIGHFHFADVPGRHQPGTGEINYHNIFAFIDKSGYDGYAGMEFFPSGDPMDAIAVFRRNFMG